MSFSPLDSDARVVLDRYPALGTGRLQLLGNHGGFSGARLWRVQTLAGDFCLRAWPLREPGIERLRWIHHQIASASHAGLSLVPVVLQTRDGVTHVEWAGRLWDVTSWMAGRADYHDQP